MLNSIHILQVEDDQDDIELMAQAFEDNGFRIRLYSIKQGDLVLPYLESSSTIPDVILLDLNLPKMHGREVLKALKASSVFREIPVVILTTSSSAEDMDYCLALGADRYIPKPATIEGFRETVTAIVTVASQNILNNAK
jgi:CheY-like chemotaxis protein